MKQAAVDLELLTIFVAVAKESSFSKAAHQLRLGKGTVSRAIARLESVLGVELLHRNTRQVALSTAGIALLERTAPHLVALEQALKTLPERGELPAGQLRLTAPHDLGALVLPPLLAEFSVEHPEIAFDVCLTNGMLDLVAGGFDLAIRATPAMTDSSLTALLLGKVELGLYGAPAYLTHRGQPHHLGDPNHDWVIFSATLNELPMRAAFGKRNLRPRFCSDDFFLVQGLLCAGVGVGLLPRLLAVPLVERRELVRIPCNESFTSKGGYFALYPSSGQVPPKVRVFVEFLSQRMKALLTPT